MPSQKLRAAKKSVILLLALLLVLLVVWFLPFGNGGSGGESAVNERSKLMIQLEELSNLPPAVDGKIEPAVKEQVREAIYLAAAAKTNKEREEKREVVLVVKATGDIGKEVKRLKGKVGGRAASLDEVSEYVEVRVDAAKVAELAGEGDVVRVYPMVYYSLMLDESVPMVKADAFWNAGFKGGGVKVAVLDTGIDATHPMLNGRVVAEKDFSGSGSANDNRGHGTHVAGTIAGSTASGGKYSGVAPEVQLLNAKVFPDTGKAMTTDIVEGIKWAVENGAKVISMSFGAPEADSAVEEQLKKAVGNGVIAVASSGNCGSGCPDTLACGTFRGVTAPGSSPNVIAVGALDKSKSVACFSSGESVQGVGIKPDFVAPGVGIKSSVPGGSYVSMAGTSMAAPHVSGAVALLLNKNPQLKQDEVKRILEKTALDLGDMGKDTSYGFGLVDMAKALVYKEGVEVGVGLEKQIISGSGQNIKVTVYDDVQVHSVKAAVTKPNGAKSAEFTFTGSGGNVFAYDYTDTVLMGNYAVEVAVNYGGTGGSSGTGEEAGSGSDGSSSITVTQTAYFKVTSLTGDFGSVEELNVSQRQFLSQSLAANVTFVNTAAVELGFSALLQLLRIDNGLIDATPSQEIRLPAVTVAANSKATAAVNNALEVGPGNYTLRILTDYGAGSLVNETNVTVVDDVAPKILGIDYKKSVQVNSAQVIVVQLYEHQKASAGLRLDKYDGQLIKPIIANYTARTIGEFGNNKTIAITIYNGSDLTDQEALNEGSGYVATLQVCDESGNCAGSLNTPKNDVEFSITGCAGRHILIVKTFETSSAFEEAAASDSSVCASSVNKSMSGTPPSSYLEKFDAVVWTTGTDIANIDDNDATALADYYGKKGKIVVEGSDVAFRHGSDDFMQSVLHSELKTDLGFTVASIADMSNLSINLTRPHPVVAGLATPVFFNATIDPFPDAVQPYNGSVELAEWSGLDTGGSAIVAYESDDGKSKSLFLPFYIGALGESASEAVAANAISWLVAEAGSDISVGILQHGFLVEGEGSSFAASVKSADALAAPPKIKVFLDGLMANEGELDLSTLADGVYTYHFILAPPLGWHSLRVVAGSDFSLPELNYINNVNDFALQVYPKLSDLSLSGLSYGYDEPSAAINISVNISNLGGAAASSAVTAYLDGVEVASHAFNVGRGETIEALLSVNAGKGAYGLKVVIDEDGSVAEFNESNNELSETIYLCSKEKVLVVDDNDAEFFSTAEPSSSGEFLAMLRNDGYCAEGWNEKESGIPGIAKLNAYPIVVWSAGDYFGGTISNEDAIAIGNFSGGLLIEGSDVGLDLAGSDFLQGIASAVFASDMLLNESLPEALVLKNHPITAGIAEINISKEKSPYPDSLDAAGTEVVAEWQNGNAAIVAKSAATDEKAPYKTAYYSFSVDGVTDAAAMEMLVLNTVQWLLDRPNSLPQISSVVASSDGGAYEVSGVMIEMNEGQTKNFSVIASDPDGDPLTYTWLLNGTVVSTTQNFSFSPKYNESGDYNLTIIISDGKAEVSVEITIIVIDVNRPAVIKGLLVSSPIKKKAGKK